MRQDKTYSEVVETNEPMVFSDVQFLFNKYEERVKQYDLLVEETTEEITKNKNTIEYLHKTIEELKSELANVAYSIAGLSDISIEGKKPTIAVLRQRINIIYDIADKLERKYRFDIYGRDRVKGE